MVMGLEFKIQRAGFRVWGSGFRSFRLQGLEPISVSPSHLVSPRLHCFDCFDNSSRSDFVGT